MGSGAKSYMIKGFIILYNVYAQIFSPYMRRLLVLHDFTPDPSEFPNIWEKFSLFFLSYQCTIQ